MRLFVSACSSIDAGQATPFHPPFRSVPNYAPPYNPALEFGQRERLACSQTLPEMGGSHFSRCLSTIATTIPVKRLKKATENVLFLGPRKARRPLWLLDE